MKYVLLKYSHWFHKMSEYIYDDRKRQAIQAVTLYNFRNFWISEIGTSHVFPFMLLAIFKGYASSSIIFADYKKLWLTFKVWNLPARQVLISEYH